MNRTNCVLDWLIASNHLKVTHAAQNNNESVLRVVESFSLLSPREHQIWRLLIVSRQNTIEPGGACSVNVLTCFARYLWTLEWPACSSFPVIGWWVSDSLYLPIKDLRKAFCNVRRKFFLRSFRRHRLWDKKFWTCSSITRTVAWNNFLTWELIKKPITRGNTAASHKWAFNDNLLPRRTSTTKANARDSQKRKCSWLTRLRYHFVSRAAIHSTLSATKEKKSVGSSDSSRVFWLYCAHHDKILIKLSGVLSGKLLHLMNQCLEWVVVALWSSSGLCVSTLGYKLIVLINWVLNNGLWLSTVSHRSRDEQDNNT